MPEHCENRRAEKSNPNSPPINLRYQMPRDPFEPSFSHSTACGHQRPEHVFTMGMLIRELVDCVRRGISEDHPPFNFDTS